jgi:teichoic acid transport system permease protein
MPALDPSPPPGLTRLGGRQPLRQYIDDVWRRREFAWSLAVGNLRSQHIDTVLGNVWHVINPLLLIGVYFLVFGVLIARDLGPGADYLSFLAVGIFIFHYCQRAITAGTTSIVSNIGLLRSLQFPRTLLPLSAVIQQTLGFGSSVAVMLLLLIARGSYPQLGWLMLVPVVGLATLFSLGGALIMARMTDRVRDVQNLLPYVFRLTFYLSGILYSVDRFADPETLGDRAELVRTLFLLNPFYDIVGIARHYLLANHVEPQIEMMWTAMFVITVVTLVGGILYFRAGESEYGRG